MCRTYTVVMDVKTDEKKQRSRVGLGVCVRFQGNKLKETLLPSLNLLTESSRVHRETRKFLRMKVGDCFGTFPYSNCPSKSFKQVYVQIGRAHV